MYIDLAETRLLFNPPGAEQNAIFFRANPKDFQKFHEYSMQSRAKNQDLAVRQSQPEANKKWPNGSYKKKNWILGIVCMVFLHFIPIL